MKFHKSLRFIIPAFIFFTSTITLMILTAVSLRAQYGRIETRMAKHVTFEASVLSNSMALFIQMNNMDALNSAIAAAATDEEVRLVLLLDENDKIIASNRYELRGTPLAGSGISVDQEIINKARRSLGAFQSFSKDRTELYSASYMILGAKPGEVKPARIGVLYEGHDLSVRKKKATYEGIILVIPIAAVLLAMSALYWIIFDRLISRRIGNLLKASEELAKGSFSSRAILEWDDEIGHLGKTFNAMAESIEYNRAVIDRQHEQLDLAVRGSNAGVWDWRINEDTVSHNSQWCRLLGLNEDHLVHPLKDFSALLHADDREMVMRRIQDCLDGKGQYVSEHRLRHSNGAYLWVLDKGDVAERDHEGKPLRMVGSFVDMSDRKKAEDAIRASEERYRLLVESGLLVAWEMDIKTWRFTYINAHAEKMSGYPREEWYKPDFWIDHLYPEDRDSAIKLCQDATKNGQDHTFEYRMTAADGRIVWLKDLVSVIKDDAGNPHSLRGFMIDISAQKKNEEVVKESEGRFRALSESAFEGIAIAEKGIILSVNGAFARMFGYGDSELIGKTPLDLALPEFHSTLRENIAKGYEGVYEVMGLRKDGSTFPLEIHGKRIIYGGKTARVTAVRDITFRKIAEREMKESFERLATILNGIEAIVVVLDMKTHEIVFANEFVKDLFGDVAGKTCWKVLQMGQTGPCPFCTNDKLLDEKGNPKGIFSWEYQNTLLKKWYSAQDRAIRWVDGRVLKLEIAVDITDRKRLEETLKNSELRLLNAQRVGRLGGWEWDIGTGAVVWSDEAYRLFGYQPGQVTPSHGLFISSVHPDDRERVERNIERQITERLPHISDECRVVRPDGSVIHIHSEVEVMYGGNGAPIMMHGTNQDITGRKLAEDALVVAKEAAEEATKLKDKFVSLVAHDMRSPLATTIGYLKLLESGHAEPLTRDQKELLDHVVENTNNMITVVDELLNISRLKTGTLVPKLAFINGYSLVVASIGTISYLAGKKGIEIVNEVAPDTRLFADAALFQEVLKNLLTNSVKFCRKGGRITVFTPQGRPSTIAIKDTGIGIKASMLPDIFRHEVKTSTPGTAQERGTGLGLPYSFEIMQAHGGTLSVESVEGAGSTFYAELPYIKPKILIVDDDMNDRVLLRGYLAALGVTVLEAEDGREALKVIGENAPHLIVADIVMPVMDGFELLEEIRKTPALSSTPFIMIAIQKNVEANEKSLRLGANDFINKPIVMEEFIPRVRRFIS